MLSAETESPYPTMRGLSGLLALIPALLGFHPTESLVLVCLRGSPRLAGPAMRVDLDGNPPDFAVSVAGHAARFGDEVVVLAYTDRSELPALLQEVVHELALLGVPLLDVARVGDGPPWTVHMVDGIALEVTAASEPADSDAQVQLVRSMSAWHGRSILSRRDELVRSVDGPAGKAVEQAAAAFDGAADRVLELLETRPMQDPDPMVVELDEVVEQALAAVGHRGTVGFELAARLAVLLIDHQLRDSLISRGLTEKSSDFLPMLISAAGSVRDRDAAELLSVLAFLAYRHGEGALANVAIDRCLRIRPDHRLCHLLVTVISTALPPAALDGFAQPQPDPGRSAGAAQPAQAPSPDERRERRSR